MELTYIERATRLHLNPHNLARFGEPMLNFDYWRARYEREGRQASKQSANPYSPDSMAGTAWQRGNDQAARYLFKVRGLPLDRGVNVFSLRDVNGLPVDDEFAATKEDANAIRDALGLESISLAALWRIENAASKAVAALP